jgi:hypothetical protein
MVRVKFRKAMDRKNINQKLLASKTGCSTAIMTKFFNKEKPITFEYVLNMAKYLVPEEEEDVMVKYTGELTDPKHLKPAIEYCSTHRRFNDLNELIERCSNHKEISLRRWADVYRLFACWQKEPSRDTLQYIIKIKEVYTDDPELMPMLSFFELYVYYALNQYQMVDQLSHVTEKLIDGMKDGYLKQSFQARLAEVMSFVELKIRTNPERSRYHCDILLDSDIGKTFDGFAYHMKGTSYLLEDEENCLHYLTKSVSYYRERHKKEVADNLERNLKLVEQYFNIINNRKLDEVFLQSVYDTDNSFVMFIQGCVQNNKSLLIRSLVRMTKNGDNFLAQLPQQKLQSLGYDESIISEIVA